MDAQTLDDIYKRYGYELGEKNKDLRVYILRKGIYYGVEIVRLTKEIDVSEVKKKYSESGFACKVRDYNGIEDVENELFNGFFNSSSFLLRIKNLYKDFVARQTTQLGQHIEYEYIDSPYISVSLESDAKERQYLKGQNIVDNVLDIISKKGAYLIVIEAAAGFGKTCTAYEILDKLVSTYSSKIPLFTELSRNRQAKIFKYVLLSEIESQYDSLIKTDLVKHHIAEGRIPLFIDGFDELLTKNADAVASGAENNEFSQVETMLSTISDMLDLNAKIILTSRKTAIFSNEHFYTWIESHSNKFEVVRFGIEKPNLKDWLDTEKLSIIEQNKLPIKHIANPVLLSYLRSLPIKEFKELIKDSDSIVEKYFEYLCDREQDRQNLRFSFEEQLSIFKNLAKLFVEFNITAEQKDFIKEILISFNNELLEKNRKLYPINERPTVEELADTLTNHALLDRVGNKEDAIGFINEFIFGTLAGQNITGENEKFDVFPEDIAEIVVTAFQFQNEQRREQLWAFISKRTEFSAQFRLFANITLKNNVCNDFEDKTFESLIFEQINFDKDCKFSKCMFKNSKFIACRFALDAFEETTFLECKFQNCTSSMGDKTDYSRSVYMYSCADFENGFIESIDLDKTGMQEESINIDREILEKFFKVDGKTPRKKYISQLMNDITWENEKNPKKVLRELERLKKDEMLLSIGNMMKITQEGINYYNKNLKSNI